MQILPPKCLIKIHKKNDKFEFIRSTNRKFDLFDHTMANCNKNSRTFYLSVLTLASDWKKWTGRRIQKMIDWIRDDLDFDDCYSTVQIIKGKDQACSDMITFKVIAKFK